MFLEVDIQFAFAMEFTTSVRLIPTLLKIQYIVGIKSMST